MRSQSKTSSSTQSLDEFSVPQGEHHQHHLELVLNSLSHLQPCEAKAGLAVRPSHWTDSANRRASITSIIWNSCKTHSPICSRAKPKQDWQLDPVIGRIQRSAGRASPASSGSRVKLTLQSAAVRSQSRTSSSTQSLDGFSEPQGEHHQHHLELVLNSLSHLQPCEAKAGLAVRPSHWTDSANRRASITSIIWNSC